MSLFQSNLRKQIRKLPKILNFVKIIHYYSKLFPGVLRNDCVAGEQFEYFAGEFLVRGASGVGVRTIAASASTADAAGDSICKDFDLRLTSAGVPSSPAGILEVFLNGAWSPLCGHYFWNTPDGTRMACIKMGYAGVSPCSLPSDPGWAAGCRFQTLDSDGISVGMCSGGEVPGACSNRRRDLGRGERPLAAERSC